MKILYACVALVLSMSPNLVISQEVANTKKLEMEKNIMFIGTYTKKEAHVNGQAQGIYSLYQNPQTGTIKFGDLVAKIVNPSYVKVSQDGKNLYAVSELGPSDAETGYIYSFKVLSDGMLEQIGKTSTIGLAPCHIAIDKTGKYIFVSNYVGGVVVLYKRNLDGTLSQQQILHFKDPKISHPHSVSLSADNKYAYIADLGNDKIWIYDFNAEKGSLSPHNQNFVALEKGAGPRQLAFSKNNEFVYSINELNNTVSAFKIKEDGGLDLFQNITSLPKDFEGNSAAAEIQIHPEGKFLYVSNRGHNSIASFNIANSGKLTFLEAVSTQGKSPRHFVISPNGDFLYTANQDSNTIAVFEINSETGKLKPIKELFPIKTPVCIEFR